MQFAGKRYWLVGASEGLGLALAQILAAEGAKVILSARDPERLGEACGKVPRASAVVVDVADTASVAAAVAQVGALDGVVFLAGVYWPMTAQAVDAAFTGVFVCHRRDLFERRTRRFRQGRVTKLYRRQSASVRSITPLKILSIGL